MKSPDLETIVDEVQSQLKSNGYIHLNEAVSTDDFLKIIHPFGKVLRKETISLYRSRRGAHQPRMLGYHTDHFDADIIAWQCDVPEPTGGPTLLVDTQPIVDVMTDHQKEALTRVEIFSPHPDRPVQLRAPCLTIDGGEALFYYTPWNLCPIQDPEVSKVWKWFVEQVESAAAFEVDLKKGECLFLDNKRFLHGRGVLPENSKRSLERVWISRTKTA